MSKPWWKSYPLTDTCAGKELVVARASRLRHRGHEKRRVEEGPEFQKVRLAQRVGSKNEFLNQKNVRIAVEL